MTVFLITIISGAGTYLGYRFGMIRGHYKGVVDEIDRCERRNGIRR